MESPNSRAIETRADALSPAGKRARIGGTSSSEGSPPIARRERAFNAREMEGYPPKTSFTGPQSSVFYMSDF